MVSSCFHCGEQCSPTDILFDDKHFCCTGCKTVYELFSENELSCYYDLNEHFGTSPEKNKQVYDFLDDKEIQKTLLDFDNDGVQVVSFYIPSMHCSSCIWVLEHLGRLNPGVRQLLVDFPKKRVRITYHSTEISLKAVAELLRSIGYAPEISLADRSKGPETIDRKLWYQLGVAGFAFGNVMLLSFPEYFEADEFWLNQFKPLFRWIMFAFATPVVFYSARDYWKSASKGLKTRSLNIDVPISIGIIALYVQSSIDIVFQLGSGYFDSLTGLVFFLLLGKVFQQKTYHHLSFERDYRSYFPIAVSTIDSDGTIKSKPVYKVAIGDRLFIRNGEIIPVDGLLLSEEATIDYAFVTGESKEQVKQQGAQVFAGGRYHGKGFELLVSKEVSQSYLTELWQNSAFSEDKSSKIRSVTDQISKRFTLAVLTIALLSTLAWLHIDSAMAPRVFTAVLIIACPCAIALAAPFTLGNAIRWLGKHGIYARDISSLERLASIDTLVFDKTGTLSHTAKSSISYTGTPLNAEQAGQLSGILQSSSHPLSRALVSYLHPLIPSVPDHTEEYPGKGIIATVHSAIWKIGSANFLAIKQTEKTSGSQVHLQIGDQYLGYFSITNSYREGIFNTLNRLSKQFKLEILSGDTHAEKAQLTSELETSIPMRFSQQPADKLNRIADLQSHGYRVVMIGDGLNDSGALAKADVGIAVSDEVNVFTPASDIIIDAAKLIHLDSILKTAKQSVQIIRYAFALSLLYNLIGTYFAVTGKLEPIIAAILMPLSSISIVVFTTIATNLIFSKQKF